MELKQIYTWLSFILTFVLTHVSWVAAIPISSSESDNTQLTKRSIDRIDRDYYLAYGRPLTNNNLQGLENGYYYVDNGYIAPVRSQAAAASSIRRQDLALSAEASSNELGNGVRFTPLVRYKQTKTKRKKLFVPNFFG